MDSFSNDPVIHPRAPTKPASTPKQQAQQGGSLQSTQSLQTPTGTETRGKSTPLVSMPKPSESPKAAGGTIERISMRSSGRSSLTSVPSSGHDDSGAGAEGLRRSSSRGRILRYSNGASKEEVDGMSITRFANGDVRRVLSDGEEWRHSLPLFGVIDKVSRDVGKSKQGSMEVTS